MKNLHLEHAEDLLITEANPFVPLNILEQVYNQHPETIFEDTEKES